jgi:hypothetical protein
MAISGTGQYQLAEDTSTTTLYISSDYGATFISALVAGSAFSSCAIDYTGQYQVAIQLGVNIWYSVNYGVTWNNVVTNLDSSQFQSASLSANAQYLLLPLNDGPFYLNRSSVWFPAGISTATAQISSLTTNSVLFEKPYFSWLGQGTTTDNCVQTSALSNLNISSGLFTLECYFNPTATNAEWGTIVSLNNGTTTGGNEFRIGQKVGASGFGMLFPSASGSADGTSDIANILPLDSWYHVALVRTSATNLFLYSNGTAVLSTTSVNYSQNQNMQLQIFCDPYSVGNDLGQGYVQSVRFTAGQALYTGNFTTPTQQLTRNSVVTSGAGAASQITGTVAFLGGVTSTFTDVGPYALALTAGSSNTTTTVVPSTFSSIFLTTFGNNLGINCNAPSFTLDVNGSANITGSTYINGAMEVNGLTRIKSNRGVLTFQGTTDTDSLYIRFQKSTLIGLIGWFGFGVGGTEFSSFFGITTPASTNIAFLPGGSAATSPPLFLGSNSRVGLGTSSPSVQLDLTTDGARKLTTNTWTTGSDQRIKKNISSANIDLCYSTLKAIDLKYFEWDTSIPQLSTIQDNHSLGFIAQEVKTVFPKAVTFDSNMGFSDFHSLNVDQLYKAHYGATKKLISIVETQSTQIAQLLSDNSTLISYIPQLTSTLRG